jgi:hypothetical protein
VRRLEGKKACRDWHAPCSSERNPNQEKAMNTAIIDDSKIETRFVWARCAAKNARAMRSLIRAFQSDGWASWATPHNVVSGKRRVVRRKKAAKR